MKTIESEASEYASSLIEELRVANKELAFQNDEKEKRAAELVIANEELAFQNEVKEKRAAELVIANKELQYQNEEKEKRAEELVIANKELEFQNVEKEKRAAELVIANYARSLIEASLDPLVTISAEGKITGLNEATVKITGIEREKLIGSDFFEYFTEPDKALEVYQEVFKNGFVANSPLTLRHTEGKLTDVLFNGSVYNDEEGNVLGIVIVARDITEKKIHDDILQESENRYRSLIENLPVAVYTCNKDGYVQLYNKAAVELWGREPDIQTDRWCGSAKIFDLDGIPIPLDTCPMAVAMQEERAVLGEEVIVERPNGERRYVLPSPQPIYDENGKCMGGINTLIDITEIRKSQQDLSNIEKSITKYSRSLIEASRDPLVTISPEGKIMDMNEAMIDVVHKSREQIEGTDFGIYFTDPQKARKIYQEVFEKGFVTDYPLTMKDGTYTDVLFNGSVYKDAQGEVLGAVVVARDITDQNKVAKELLEAKVLAEMGAMLAEEAQGEAERSANKAKEAVKAKQQFLSNMSHEIRTPMNAIIGFTKVVMKTELTARQREYLNAIKLSGDALIVLINDILDLAKVDAGKMSFEKAPFKMAASISSMLQIFDTKIQEKNLSLEIEYDNNIPETLVGDAVRLHQIIMNLLSNAIKFTNDGKITMAVRLLKADEKDVVVEFEVSDTGIGISASKIDKIFENFQQASSSTARIYGGTGLGLAISKQLVEQQGGSISVVSKEGEGSTFTFNLRLQKTELEQLFVNEIVEITQGVKNIRVLVAEDIPLNQLLMRTLLDDFGFESDIVANGKIAVEKMATTAYDIILMDLQMPELNGFEATEYIRNTLHSDIPIIALTADVTTVDLAKCKSVGMNDYLAKPVDERILYAKIVGLIKKPLPLKEITSVNADKDPDAVVRYIDMTYLNQRTKSNPKLMMEMIALYLEHTPPLISTMKQSFEDKDWDSLHAVVHKLIPSFAIMGMSTDFENMAKEIQNYAIAKQRSEGVYELVNRLEAVCNQACIELEEEYARIKNTAL